MRLTFVHSLALAALAFSAAPALAGEAVTMHVPYADLDLTSEDQLAELKTRIADAAEAACAPADAWYASTNAVYDCKNTLTRKAYSEVEALRAGALAEQP